MLYDIYFSKRIRIDPNIVLPTFQHSRNYYRTYDFERGLLVKLIYGVKQSDITETNRMKTVYYGLKW